MNMIVSYRAGYLLNDVCEFDRIEGGNYKIHLKTRHTIISLKKKKSIPLNLGKSTFKNFTYYVIILREHEGKMQRASYYTIK